MKTILSIDVQGIVSIGLEKVVKNINEKWIVESASNSSEVYLKLREEKEWDLIILAISFDGKSGFEVLQDIRCKLPDTPVLMFSTHKSIEFVRRSLKLGAYGYLTKDSNEAEITTAIKTVIEGGHYINENMRDELIFSPNSGNYTTLSEREFEVLIMIGRGYNTKEIADELHLSVNTVDTYRSRIKEKLNLTRDSHMIHYCFAAGLVKVNPHTK